MIDSAKFDEVSEFYEVEKTIVVVIDGETIRIEAMKRIDCDPPRYETRGYIEREVMLTPVYGADGKAGDGVPTEMSVWVAHHLPWTDGKSADDALTQALALRRLP